MNAWDWPPVATNAECPNGVTGSSAWPERGANAAWMTRKAPITVDAVSSAI